MKTILKTLVIAFVGTLTMSSCSNTKPATSSATSTKTQPSYNSQVKDTKAQTSVAVKVDPRKAKAISATKTKKAVSTVKTNENNTRK